MATIFKMFIGTLLTAMSLLLFADSPKFHMDYDPEGNRLSPYIFGIKEDDRDTTKRPVRLDKNDLQGYLFVMTGQPEDFKIVFDYFNQFGDGLDINFTSTFTRDSYLTWALHDKHWDIASYLIEEQGIKVDHWNANGITALMQAAECGHLSTVEKLIQANAKTLIEDNQKETALTKAIKGRNNNYCPEGDYDAVISILESDFILNDKKR